jgi:hypothetical protein
MMSSTRRVAVPGRLSSSCAQPKWILPMCWRRKTLWQAFQPGEELLVVGLGAERDWFNGSFPLVLGFGGISRLPLPV